MRRIDKAIAGAMNIIRNTGEVPAQQEALEKLFFETFGSCACKADELEPIFTLRARDSLAIDTLEAWMDYGSANGMNDQKLAQAEADREAFQDWVATNGCKLPD